VLLLDRMLVVRVRSFAVFYSHFLEIYHSVLIDECALLFMGPTNVGVKSRFSSYFFPCACPRLKKQITKSRTQFDVADCNADVAVVIYRRNTKLQINSEKKIKPR
jgi:hypothetical protein